MRSKAYSPVFGVICLLLALPTCSDNSGNAGSRGGAGGVGIGSGGAAGAGIGSGGAAGAEDASVSPDGAVCNQLAATAQAQFQSYLDSTSSMACRVDSDCSFLSLQSLNCFAACGLLVGTADVSAVTAAGTTTCDQYVGAGCPEIRLTCPRLSPYCDSGRCSNAFRASIDAAASDASDAGVAPDAAVCNQLSVAAQTQYKSYLDSTASLACQTDSDCSFLYLPKSLACFPSCGDLVATADISPVAAVTASVCDQYWAADCPMVTPPPCTVSFGSCAHGHCARDVGAGGASGGSDGGASDTGDSAGSDGGVSFDSGVSSKCSACGSDELCVGYYDGLCTPMGSHCVKVSASTRESILVKHESCFMKPTGDEICGNSDGGVFWGCGDPRCPDEPLVSDINCYGP